MAARINAALANHPDAEARRWRYREITRAVIETSGVQMSEDTGRTWMAGSQPRDPRVAAALAAVLRVTAGWLYFGEPPVPDFAQPAARSHSPLKTPDEIFGEASGKRGSGPKSA